MAETFHKNGKLEIKCAYKDDELDGLYEEFNKDEQLIEKSIYKNGQLISQFKH